MQILVLVMGNLSYVLPAGHNIFIRLNNTSTSIKVTDNQHTGDRIRIYCNLIELLISKNSHYETDVLFLKQVKEIHAASLLSGFFLQKLHYSLAWTCGLLYIPVLLGFRSASSPQGP